MKVALKIFFSFISLSIFYSCEKEDEIKAFEDYQFLSTLIKKGIDTDGNGAISSYEASMVKSLDVSYDRISDLKGIEIFINLEILECRSNQLSNIDISENKSLKILDCGFNQLRNIDVLKNPELAAVKLKETGNIHWDGLNNGTNESGFSALPGIQAGFFAGWWSTIRMNSEDPPVVWCYFLLNGINDFLRSEVHGEYGQNVRCIKDE